MVTGGGDAIADYFELPQHPLTADNLADEHETSLAVHSDYVRPVELLQNNYNCTFNH